MYVMITQRPITFGQLERRTARLRLIAKLFVMQTCRQRSAATRRLAKAPCFFVTAICGAIYLAGGGRRKPSGDSAFLTLMTHGIGEGIAAVRGSVRLARDFH